MEKLVTVLVGYAAQQVEAGADVIQIFDSWAGALSVTDYRDYVLPRPTTELVQRVQALGVPVIYFGVDTASLLRTMRETGADVLGLDWRVPLDEAGGSLGYGCAVQGNLDPIALFAPEGRPEARVEEVLTRSRRTPGHIFNLGHGIVPGHAVEQRDQRGRAWVKRVLSSDAYARSCSSATDRPSSCSPTARPTCSARWPSTSSRSPAAAPLPARAS